MIILHLEVAILIKRYKVSAGWLKTEDDVARPFQLEGHNAPSVYPPVCGRPFA
jgi:hypothetical protein